MSVATLLAMGLTVAIVSSVRSFHVRRPAGMSPRQLERVLSQADQQAGSRVGFTRVNRVAPAIVIPRLDGRGLVRLTSLAGRPAVINFWSSSCSVCVEETAAIAEVARLTRGRVSFLGIDTLDSRSAAIAFIRRYRVPYEIAYDPTGAVGAKYGIPGLPVTFFLSRSGRRILGANIGALTAGELAVILRRLYGPV